MKLRHELKFELSAGELLILRSRVAAVMHPDAHGDGGLYTVRSLYFDSASDKALREKQNGISRREKFRIRCYNGDTDFIRLEKKTKLNGLGCKESTRLTETEVGQILSGDIGALAEHPSPLVRELYVKMRVEGLMPKTLVEYTREAYTFPAGNVRVTFDSDIRTGLRATELLDPECIMLPAGDTPVLMELKWDEYLPRIIEDAVRLPERRAGAFSKYAQCRIYG